MLAASSFSGLCTVLLFAGTCISAATPSFQSHELSNHLAKRALPQFVGFDNNANGKTRLSQAFIDMATMVNRCLKDGDQATFNSVHAHWFPSTAASQTAVRSILSAMVNPASSDGTGSTTLAQIQVSNDDPYGICTSAAGMIAYTQNAQAADGANDASPLNMHFCQNDQVNALNLPDLSSVTCTAIGNTLSTAMQTLGGYALVHELTHVQPVSGATIAGLNIAIPNQQATCQFSWDFEYGPQKCQAMLQPTTGPDPQTTLANADSYAWFVTELYWTLMCNRNFAPPATNQMVPTNVCDESKLNCQMR